MEHVAGIAGWLVSAALLLYVAGRVGRRFGETIGDQFWITVAAIVLQIAVVAQVLSPVHQLRPVAFLIVQVIVALIVRLTIKPPAFDRRLFRDHVRLLKATPTRRMLLLVIGLLLLLALAVIIAVPINGFDDRMYRASRAAYWLQHRSLLPWNSQNDRQTAFPFGGELMFFWPILFTRDEVLGRLSFFAGIPLCAAGLYTVMRQLRVSRTVALIGVLILLTTPTFARIEEGLYQEVWMTAFALGAAYFALRSSRDGRYLAWMACFTVMAVNVKTTALALAPAAALVPLLLPGRRSRGLGSVLLGAMAGVMFSGLALTIAMNLQRDHRPLGPAGMTSTHTADRSATQLRTHAARFVANLIDFPVIPSEPLRQSLSDAGNAWLRLCRADEPLSMEDPANPWPGTFHFGVGRYASRLSLPGMFWLPVLAAAAVVVVRRGANWRRLAILLLFATPMLLGAVLVIRWMGGMDRFWLPAYALSLPVGMYFAQRMTLRRRGVTGVAIALLLVTMIPAAWDQLESAKRWFRVSPTESMLNEPFHSVLAKMPPGSRTLAVLHADARDYGLFRPRERFASEVIPWGNIPFDPQRMRRLIDGQDATHVLVQDDHRVLMNWGPHVETTEMVRWLTQQPDLREIDAVSPGMRLFVARRPADTVPVSPFP